MTDSALCTDCRWIISDWLRSVEAAVDEGDTADDDLQLSCRRDGRRTFRFAEVHRANTGSEEAP